MATRQKISFKVTVDPKMDLDTVDNVYGAHVVRNEDIRKKLGGGGTITGTDNVVNVTGWEDGVHADGNPLTSDGTTVTPDVNTVGVLFKHTGTLVSDGSASAIGDLALVTFGSGHGNNTDDVIVSGLANGEAVFFPRPQPSSVGKFTLQSYAAHVQVEITLFGKTGF